MAFDINQLRANITGLQVIKDGLPDKSSYHANLAVALHHLRTIDADYQKLMEYESKKHSGKVVSLTLVKDIGNGNNIKD